MHTIATDYDQNIFADGVEHDASAHARYHLCGESNYADGHYGNQPMNQFIEYFLHTDKSVEHGLLGLGVGHCAQRDSHGKAYDEQAQHVAIEERLYEIVGYDIYHMVGIGTHCCFLRSLYGFMRDCARGYIARCNKQIESQGDS